MTTSSKSNEPGTSEADWARMRGMPKKLTELLEKESDRGAILIVAAYLDEIVGLIVQSACVSDKLAKDMLEWNKPAGNFSSRITLCAAFGLIHGEEARALDLVRRIRNKAAHFDEKRRGFDVLFDSESTANQVRDLAETLGVKSKQVKQEKVRATFETVSRLLATRLYVRGFNTTSRQMPMSIKEVANQIRQDSKGTSWGKHSKAIEASLRDGDFEPAMKFFRHLASSLEERNDQGHPKESANGKAKKAKKKTKAKKVMKATIAKATPKKRKKSAGKDAGRATAKDGYVGRKPRAKKSNRSQTALDE